MTRLRRMNASVGYFTADRADFDDGVFPDEIFSKREAWFWIRANVAYRPSSVIVGASTIELQPGQLAFSLRFLAARWGWASPMHVKRFLGWLAKRGRIAITSDRDRTMIEVTDEAEKPVFRSSGRPPQCGRCRSGCSPSGGRERRARGRDLPATVTASVTANACKIRHLRVVL